MSLDIPLYFFSRSFAIYKIITLKFFWYHPPMRKTHKKFRRDFCFAMDGVASVTHLFPFSFLYSPGPGRRALDAKSRQIRRAVTGQHHGGAWLVWRAFDGEPIGRNIRLISPPRLTRDNALFLVLANDPIVIPLYGNGVLSVDRITEKHGREIFSPCLK